MKRRRLRKWAKWACTLAAGALIGLWVLSELYICEHDSLTAGGNTLCSAGFGEGAVFLGKWDGWAQSGAKVSEGWRIRRNDLAAWGYWAEFVRAAGGLRWFPGIHCDHGQAGWMLTVALPYPALLTCIPAGWLWWTDRRRSGPHACGGCGYSRRGLAVGVKCPECGAVPKHG
jgi:hypothetical protein